MARGSTRAPRSLTEDERERLQRLAGSRTAAKREVERAEILLRYARGESIDGIGRAVGVSRPTVHKCVDKALAARIETGLKDTYHRPRAPEITPHMSKETMAYLASRPERFIYAHTPKHGSWLNLIEAVFSKMSRTFLRHVRVSSKEEMVERIMKGIQEVNRHPVVFRWRNFDKLAAEA